MQNLPIITDKNTGKNIPADFAEQVAQILQQKRHGVDSTITPEQFAETVKHIENGEKIADACKITNMSVASFYRIKKLRPAIQDVFVPAHETGLAIRVETSLSELTGLNLDGKDHKEAQVLIRHKESSHRATMDYASRIDGAWCEKKQNMNLNVNTTIKEGDASKWFNG